MERNRGEIHKERKRRATMNTGCSKHEDTYTFWIFVDMYL